MDWKKFFIAFLAAFGFLFLFGFLWYGMFMHGAHQEVPALFRTEAEFKEAFLVACSGTHRDGFLSDAPMRPLCSGGGRGPVRLAGPVGGAGL